MIIKIKGFIKIHEDVAVIRPKSNPGENGWLRFKVNMFDSVAHNK